MVFRREGVPMGLPMASEFDRQYTDTAAVRAARDALDSINP
jgi:copper homeostasis protein